MPLREREEVQEMLRQGLISRGGEAVLSGEARRALPVEGVLNPRGCPLPLRERKEIQEMLRQGLTS